MRDDTSRSRAHVPGPSANNERQWTSAAGRQALERMLTSYKAFWPEAERLKLVAWERELILLTLKSLVSGRRGRRPRARAIRRLSHELEMSARYEVGHEVYTRLVNAEAFRGNRSHLVRLLAATSRAGEPSTWNAWRKQSRERPDLRGALLHHIDASDLDLRRARLEGANLWGARLRDARLDFADLRNATLDACDARYATLRGADLRGATLENASFAETDLREAKLQRAHLIGTMLNRSKVAGLRLKEALVWGVSTWDLQGNPDPRGRLWVLTGIHPLDYEGAYEPSDSAPVANLEVAHFISLLATAPKIGRLIDAAATRLVLLLGRFRGDERRVLEVLKERLPSLGYVPVVFDFEELQQRDLIETVAILAGLSCFVIANLSRPRSTPLESHLIIPSVAVPFVPIIREPERPFAMFKDLRRKYRWVLPTVTFRDEDDLLQKLPTRIVRRAAEMAKSLRPARRG